MEENEMSDEMGEGATGGAKGPPFAWEDEPLMMRNLTAEDWFTGQVLAGLCATEWGRTEATAFDDVARVKLVKRARAVAKIAVAGAGGAK
jgi:hypothetical protein